MNKPVLGSVVVVKSPHLDGDVEMDLDGNPYNNRAAIVVQCFINHFYARCLDPDSSDGEDDRTLRYEHSDFNKTWRHAV